MFLLKKLLKSWFDEKNSVREKFWFFHTVYVKLKQRFPTKTRPKIDQIFREIALAFIHKIIMKLLDNKKFSFSKKQLSFT